MSLRKTLRPYILPLQEILADFQGMQFARALDIGAGTGLFLELFHRYGIIQRGLGVETNRQYFRKINEDLAIVGVDDIAGERFDLILFNDVLHHVDNKEELIRRYAADFLVDGGQVFVKEVDNRNLLYTWKYHPGK
jgi:2-polyprenyl-3-methyl-5-hydroxy-6-metoxy-1,4-benzoquinol methylase